MPQDSTPDGAGVVVVVVVVVKEKKRKVVPKRSQQWKNPRAARTIQTCRAETDVLRRAEAGTGKGAGSTIPDWLPAHMVPVVGDGRSKPRATSDETRGTVQPGYYRLSTDQPTLE